jgi:hypothetical protein
MLARRLGIDAAVTAGDRGSRMGWKEELAPPTPVRSLEEQVLEHLFQREMKTPLPPPSELPPPEVFLDPECRNIYRAFCTLYAGGDGSPPDARSVQAELGPQTRAIDRIAKIMLEGNFVSGRSGLLESLDKLTYRWRRQRLRELQRGVMEADRQGDSVLARQLNEEKDRLSRDLHRVSSAKAGRDRA